MISVILTVSLLASYWSISTFAVHDAGLFELDGNALDEATAGDDWQNGVSGAATTFFHADSSGSNDDVFTTGGSKDDLDLSSWKHKIAGTLDKDNLTNAYAAAFTAGGLKVYFGADRFSNDGTAQMGFWFFKNEISVNPNGTFNGVHADGDVLVQSNFTGGGDVSTIRVFRWTNGALVKVAEAGLQECSTSGANDLACGEVNSAPTTAPWAYTPKPNIGSPGTFPTGTFYEGGINMSLLFGSDPVPCFSSFLAETRSSAPFDSVLKDFVLGEFNVCSSVTIIKQADPEGSQSFAYTTSGAGLSNFSLVDDGTTANTRSFTDLNPGTRTVTEGTVTGWDLVDIQCVDPDGGSTVDLATRAATIDVDFGEHITCTFFNEARGTIIVEKQTDPDGAAGSFTYTGDAAGTIGDGGQITVSDLPPGVYTSTESDPTPAFDLTSISCSSSDPADDSSGDVPTRTATFNLDPGETITCVFTNTQRGRILVDKVTVPGGHPQLFEFDPSYGANFFLADADPPNDSGLLLPGTHSVAEVNIPNGWQLQSATCSDGSDPASIALGPGEVVTCTFTDVASGAITVTKTAKHADTSGATQPNLVAEFTITDSLGNNTVVSTDANGVVCVPGLPLGNATVTETGVPAGYAGDDPVVVTVTPGACASGAIPASFENTPLTDVTVSVDSQVDGATLTVISCTDGDGNLIDSVTVSDGDLTIEDLLPTAPDDTLVCTITIDP